MRYEIESSYTVDVYSEDIKEFLLIHDTVEYNYIHKWWNPRIIRSIVYKKISGLVT